MDIWILDNWSGMKKVEEAKLELGRQVEGIVYRLKKNNALFYEGTSGMRKWKD